MNTKQVKADTDEKPNGGDTLHDGRRVFHFWMDDEVIDSCGPLIGPYGIAVYAYLARRAKLKASFPSHARIAKDIGASRDTVMRTLKKLEAEHLITIESRLTESGDPDTNRYVIQDLTHLHKQGSSSQHGGVVAVSYRGSSCEQHEVFPLKDPHLKLEDPPVTHVTSPKGDHGAFQGKAPASKRRTKSSFPLGLDAQDALKASIFDDDFRRWYGMKGLTLDLDQQWETFRGKALANGYRYLDWRHAFMNWLTSDFQTAVRNHPPKQHDYLTGAALLAAAEELQRNGLGSNYRPV